MRRVVVVAFVLSLVGCGSADRRAAPPAPAVVTIVQDDAEYLHRQRAQLAGDLDDLRRIGVDWIRVTAGWGVIAPRPHARRPPRFDATDPDAYPRGAWRSLDRVVAMARARGLGVNIDVGFWAPRWAVARPTPDPLRQRWGIDARRFADFAEAVARRYPATEAFTVWNEPNLSTFLLPQWRRDGDGWRVASADVYRRMVRAAVPRLKAAAPEATVLIGGLSSLGESEGRAVDDRVAPLTFLRALACVDAALKPLGGPGCRDFEPLPGDGWAHHPYSSRLAPWQHDPNPDTARIADVGRLSELLHALFTVGRTENDLGIWITEYGYQTNPPDPTWDVSLADQARWLAEAERLARADPAVRSVAQFLVRDLPPVPSADRAVRWRDFQSGLRFRDGRAKPALAAYALPLVARRTGPGEVAFWGLVRPGTGERVARVQVHDGDGWATLAELTTATDGTFAVTARTDPAATFRLVSGGRSGGRLAGARG